VAVPLRHQAWQKSDAAFPLAITVPFPWGSALSGLKDEAPIGWYARTIEIPAGWGKQRVFLVVGASDWHTTAWLDGQKLGEHKGGYTAFEFELTQFARPGTKQRLTIRVDDVERVQARRQAGLRQCARHLADALPRGPGRFGARHAALHAGHRREERWRRRCSRRRPRI